MQPCILKAKELEGEEDLVTGSQWDLGHVLCYTERPVTHLRGQVAGRHTPRRKACRSVCPRRGGSTRRFTPFRGPRIFPILLHVLQHFVLGPFANRASDAGGGAGAARRPWAGGSSDVAVG